MDAKGGPPSDMQKFGGFFEVRCESGDRGANDRGSTDPPGLMRCDIFRGPGLGAATLCEPSEPVRLGVDAAIVSARRTREGRASP